MKYFARLFWLKLYVFLVFVGFIGVNNIVKAQMVTGKNIPEFNEVFNLNSGKNMLDVYLIESSIPGNVLWKNDSIKFTIQVVNKSNSQIQLQARVGCIPYATKARPGDIWVPYMYKMEGEVYESININIAPNSFANFSYSPKLGEKNAAYGLVTDFGDLGQHFITSFVRTFSASTQKIQFPKFCLDDISNDVLSRLGCQGIRAGVDYKPTTDPDFEDWLKDLKAKYMEYKDANIAVLLKLGAPENYGTKHPIGVPRPWLDDNNVMKNTKCDMAWIPALDDDFKNFTYRIIKELGWPKGPINAVALWNEPWDGTSISGWGADILRYREIYPKMVEGVETAEKEVGVDVLVGGCSSTSNAFDKLFCDGTDTFLPDFDFISIHYQGMQPFSTGG